MSEKPDIIADFPSNSHLKHLEFLIKIQLFCLHNITCLYNQVTFKMLSRIPPDFKNLSALETKEKSC